MCDSDAIRDVARLIGMEMLLYSYFHSFILITQTVGLHVPACLWAHMVVCLVGWANTYVIWTAGTLADPAVIDWSQAHIDNGPCKLPRSHSDAIHCNK